MSKTLSSTIRAKGITGSRAYSDKRCFSPEAPCSDLRVFVPIAQGTQLIRATINLLSNNFSDVKSVAACFGYNDLKVLCVAPSMEVHSQIRAICPVRSLRSLSRVTTVVGHKDQSTIPVSVSAADAWIDVLALCARGQHAFSDRRVTLAVGCTRRLHRSDLVVVYPASGHIKCITSGKLESTVQCWYVTPTLASDMMGIIHQASKSDHESTLSAVAYRPAGNPMECSFIQVVPGERNISVIHAIAVSISMPLSDLRIHLHGVVDGPPAYTLTVSDNHFIVNAYNFDHKVITSASMTYSGGVTQPTKIQKVGRVWQIYFESLPALKEIPVISVHVSPDNKNFIVSELKGPIIIL